MKKILFSFVLISLMIFSWTSVCSAQAKKPANTTKKAGAKSSQWNKIVVLETTQGKIEVQLLGDTAPKACENFVSLVRKGYYNGIIFHRVIKGFMIQGGDPLGNGTGGQSVWGKPFEDEFDPNVKFDQTGLLAMANAGPKTNGSQFFITTNVEHTKHLHMRHTIFGKVISGMDVVTKIENTETGPNDKPKTPQVIKKAYIKGEAEQAPKKK